MSDDLTGETGTDADEPNTAVNAVVGALVTVVTAPLLPVAAVVGGAVAGYLQRGDLGDGALVGGLSGAVAAIPAFLIVWLLVGLLLLGGEAAFALGSAVAVAAFLALLGYLVAAGAVGGALGAYLRREL
jgi:hypothetical protein